MSYYNYLILMSYYNYLILVSYYFNVLFIRIINASQCYGIHTLRLRHIR